MFVFVCPIRHPASSNDYASVLTFLNNTIQSLNSQYTDRPYKIIVVCNEMPPAPESFKNTEFVEVDFPPPDMNKGTQVPLELVKDDKGCKISIGLLYAKRFAPDYAFVIDGDDWFNIDTIEHVYKSEPGDLFYANSGYVVNLAEKTVLKKFGLCRYCGSVYIYRFSTLMTLSGLSQLEYSQEVSKEVIYQVVAPVFLKQILGNHRHQLHTFRSEGLRIQELSIPVVAWILNTGENHSAQNPGKHGLPLSQEFLKQFGVSSLQASDKPISLNQRIKAILESLQSYIGWQMTDKKQTMI
ncbi:hypothetical protein [uncultured Alteromonas sp.]|jgi:hypothetical protein|uniref:hypothetical protein n=1 Tax=uncultured Alteromonas sp. TaxID=179113 RepID=UPI0025D2A265|nr:hypothetical protein [uncultured Alteromonas sp.]